jgi:hypothetical protein
MTVSNQTLTSPIGLWPRISGFLNNPDFAAVALFAVLGLLICLYLMAHLPLSLEDAAFFYLLS